ncbi:zinc finger MYM-type protein 1-like [Lissotriton helveticus]
MNTVEQLLANPFLGLSPENKLIIKRLGPDRPDLQLQQTFQDRGKIYKRTFSNTWYTKVDWLTGSTSKNALFCFPCLLFGGDLNWTANGVTNLKHLANKIKKHAHLRCHLENVTRLGMLGKETIESQISDTYRRAILKHNEAVDKNRRILSTLIDCIRFCDAFERVLQGNDETESTSNPYIYRGLVDLMASLDHEMEAHLENVAVLKGTSKTIQNELLECMLAIIRSYIVQQMKTTDFVAIQADNPADAANKSQALLIFRYIENDIKLVERFYGFIHFGNSIAETVATSMLTELDLVFPEHSEKQKLIAQSYDGASVTSGIFGGTQKKIRDVYPNAHYVHCYAHKLNHIVPQAVVKISDAKHFFLDVAGIAAFFSGSSKRTKILQDIVESRVPNGSAPCLNFNMRTVNLIYECRIDLEECFDAIEANGDFEIKTRSEARGFTRALHDREFQFFLFLFHEIMSLVDTFHNQLQKPDIETVFIQWATIQFVTGMNKVREGIDSLDSRLPKDSIFSKGRQSISSLVRIAKEICDTIVEHAKQRFFFTKHLVSATLLQSDQFANYDISFPEQALHEAVETYPILNKEDLRMELTVLYGMHVYRQAKGVVSLLALIQKLNMENSLTETMTLLKILLTTPMTTTESERCFPTLKRIKMFLRSTMMEEGLNALAMLSIERDLVKQIPDFNIQVIEKFAAIKDRHADFIYKK